MVETKRDWRVMFSKRLLLLLCCLMVVIGNNQVSAKDRRMGVLFPGDVQQQAAVLAAQGDNEPLEQPEIVLSAPASSQIPVIVEPSELEKKVARTLESITLEEKIQKQVLQAELEQFGYDIFTAVPTTFVPVEGIPVPLDYIIGPGDTFIVQIYGATDVQYRLVVTREGKLLIPEVGDLQVSGLTFEEAKIHIKGQISKLRIGVKSVITLAELHTIRIMMVGDVVQPGAYTVSGLSSLLNTLITTGGIKRTGSLRNIQVRRQGRVVTSMDLYQVLLKGEDKGDIFLHQGDTIFVPPIGATIGVAGEVHRPAIYELKYEGNVSEVLALTGGLLPTAAKRNPHIERITSGGLRTLISVDLEQNGGRVEVKNGDLLRIFPVLRKMDNVVLLSGHVLNPGGFQWHPGMHVSDLINSPALLRQSAEYQVALIERELPSIKQLQAIYFNLGAILANPGDVDDLQLQPRDQLIVFDTHSPRGKQVVEIVRKFRLQASASSAPMVFNIDGNLRHKGEYPLQQGMRLLDALDVSGGIRAGTDMSYTLLVRKDQLSSEIEFVQLSLSKAVKNSLGDHNPVILPEDRIYIFDSEIDRAQLIAADIQRLKQQTRYGELSPVVNVTGKVVKPGTYPLIPGMRLQDLIIAAGGMKEEAFGLAATLSRQVVIGGEYSSIDHIDVPLTGGKREGYSAAMILHPYDHLLIREKPEWISQSKLVRIEGEVIYPGEYKVDKRETLCGLVQRAGGFSEDAYLFGTVFLRESVRKREQQAMDRLFDALDDQLVNVHLSPGFQKDEKLPINKGATDIQKVIKQLKRNRAVGRLVIDIENAVSRCHEESDIVLEGGDRLIVPKYKEDVTVVGEVYFPASHLFRSDRAARDYINLSGGTRELAIADHAYVVQANGEVMTARTSSGSWGWLTSPANIEVTPGSTIYVPLSVDRINIRESTQSWLDLIYKLAISAATVDYLFTN